MGLSNKTTKNWLTSLELSGSARVQGWRQGVAKSSELLIRPPYEEVGPQMGWPFPHHQSRLPCCRQAPTLHTRETCPPCCLRLQHLPLYPSQNCRMTTTSATRP